MRLSFYNIFVEGKPDRDSCLLFNSRTQALVKLDKNLAQKLQEGRFSEIEPDYLSMLAKQGVIVESQEQEKALMERFFFYIKNDMRKIPYEVTILTTYSCNFSCVYCFEEDVRKPIYMSQEVAKATVDWTVRTIKERGYKFLFVVFYGGEPFLNFPIIQYLANSFYQQAKKEGFGLGFGAITNGSLLDREKILWLKERGLREVRVTLDGPEYVHNKRRPFRDGRGTFRVIIENLKQIKNLVDIAISCNFDETSVGQVEPLLDVLIEEGLGDSINYLMFSPIMPRLEREGKKLRAGLNNCGLLFKSHGLLEESQVLARRAVEKGFNVRTSLGINLCPMVMRDGAVTVDALGKLFKCNSFVGFNEFCVGTVFNGWNENYERFVNLDAQKDCPISCVYLPMCQGGCRFFSFIENENLKSPYCCKEYLDRNIAYLVELEYKKQKDKR